MARSTVTGLVGAVIASAGVATWALIAKNLADEQIAVADDAVAFAGAPVTSPWTAWVQADTIKKHALQAAGGRTYAEVSGSLQARQRDLRAEGKTAAEVAQDAEVAKLTAARTVAMDGSFLRSSLFTSVIAFGVSLLAVGTGASLVLLSRSSRR